MTRTLALRLLAVSVVLLLGVWIARHYTFEETTIELPLTGEAADHPRYALEHLLANAGVRVQTVSTLEPPATHGVFFTDWYARDAQGHGIDGLEQWVRHGGHLVVGAGNVWREPFQHWTGIEPAKRPKAASAPAHRAPSRKADACEPVQAQAAGVALTQSLCGVAGAALASRQPAVWSLADEQGLLAVSVSVGSGWVTVLPPYGLYSNRDLTRGDNARLLLGAFGVRRGDLLYLYDEIPAESLWRLLWRLAAPGIVLLAIALLLLILRALPRFGTPIPAPAPLRRSLAEQIRATALFAWRTRRLQALRRAVVRALEESAGRQIAAYRMLDSRRRTEVLAAATGLDAARLRAAMYPDAGAPPEVQRTAIATLQMARRRFIQRLSTRGAL